MRRAHFRPAALTLAALLGLASPFTASAQTTDAGPLAEISIPAQALGPALNELARQANLQLLFPASLVAGKAAPAVSGRLTPQQALQRLLAGSGLQSVTDGSVVTIRPAPPPSQLQLPAVTVRADGLRETARGPVDGYVARRSATATRTDTPLNEIPQSISVITADQMSDQGVQATQEALRYASGVVTEIYGSRNTTEYFLIRGSKGTTLLDGLRLPQDWYADPRDEPYAFERIEVLRGPSSVMAGQNGPGGLVNKVSKRPLPEARRELSVQIGNHARRQVAADLTGPVDAAGRVSYRLVALGSEAGSQVEHADYRREFLAPSITWKPSAGTTLTGFAEYQRDRNRNNDAFLPVIGTLRPAPNGYLSPNLYVSEPGWDGNTGKRWRAGYAIEQALTTGWTLRHQLRHDDVDRQLRSMYTAWWDGFVDASGTPDPNGRYLNRYAGFDQGRTRTTAGDLLVEGRFAWGAARHTLLIGADMLQYKRKDAYWEVLATPLDVYAPVYGQWTPPSPVPPPDAWVTDPKVRQTGLLLQDQVKLGERWALQAGLRRDEAKTVSSSERIEVGAWTKNFGAVWLADGGWSPYLSYAESFEAQGASRTGRVFAPKRGAQVEAGIKWMPQDRPLRATASVYRLQEKNRLKDDPANPLNQIESDPVTVTGVELEAAATLGRWDLVGALSHTSARDDQSGQHIEFVPARGVSLWALHRFGGALQGLRAGLGVRHVGERWNGLDTVVVPGVTLVDAVLGWDAGAWRLALNVTNLANRRFVASCTSSDYCWYGSTRKLVGSLSYRF